MFELSELQTMVCGAYKKLKSYYYYDKTLLYIKKNIAWMEAKKDFGEKLNEIGLNLYLENTLYFDELIEEIDFKVMSKKLKANKPGDITQKDIDHNKSIYTLNFYIDAPVELLIVDCLWMLFIGKIISDVFGESKYSYAGKFKKSLFRIKDPSLVSGIEFSSNRSFEPYYQSYEVWRNNAIKMVGECKNKTDLVLMSLDFKSFYYSVNFDFSKIGLMLKNDPRLSEMKFLTDVIEKTYRRYTKIVNQYKESRQETTDTCMLPIGLLSPIVLRNLYMMRFDRSIKEVLSPLYYGRYVDDILLVLDSKDVQNTSVELCIRNYLLKTKLFKKLTKTRINYVKDNALTIQVDKVRCYYFQKGSKDTLLKSFYEHIGSTVSEANLLPDIETLSKTISKKAYNYDFVGEYRGLRDTKLIDSNYYNVVRFINGLKFTLKNVYSGYEEANKYLEEIIDLYQGSSTIEFFSSWRTVFELFVLVKDQAKMKQFYEMIQSYIEGLEFHELKQGEIYRKKYKVILFRLKKSLMEHLAIACALAVGLDYGAWKEREGSKVFELARVFRKVNLINHDMVFLPLVNYTNLDVIKEESLVEYRPCKDYTINQRKMDYSPRFIRLDEFYIWYFICYYNNENRRDIDYEEVFHQYLEDNAIEEPIRNPIIRDEKVKNSIKGGEKDRELLVKKIEVDNKEVDSIRVGIVNTSITEEEALKVLEDPIVMCTYARKVKLFKLLNIAAEEKVDYLVFPEFYMPLLWINEISMFAKQMGITIITGMQYITFGKVAYNYTCIIARAEDNKHHRNSVVFFREKNFYAPDEKFELAKRGYRCKDREKPFYYVIKDGKVVFSTVLCFEFTDILSRAILKSLINVLFIPQLNKDTHYFSSVVEATARDLHAFVIQSNTAKYGDSRITLPAKTAYREIAQVKGGLNDVILVNEINLEEFCEFQRQYEPKLESVLEECLSCDHSKACSICEIDSNSYKHYKYKGLPPYY
ncbi:MAG: reverse transcriptase domain-containing protein [bacterium]|nr:reverse transcriptase domain-containing protein [bacterium]